MAKLSKELSEAICDMPAADKNKLLLKLVAKDEWLIESLNFELVEHKSTNQARVERLKSHIENTLNHSMLIQFFTPGELLMAFRNCNARIKENTKITKNAWGEVELICYMLHTGFVLHENRLKITYESRHRYDTLTTYTTKKMAELLLKMDKFHEDMHLELRPKINRCLGMMWQNNNFINACKTEKLPKKI